MLICSEGLLGLEPWWMRQTRNTAHANSLKVNKELPIYEPLDRRRGVDDI